MGKRKKLWLSIQAATLAGVATLGACSMESEGDAHTEGEGNDTLKAQSALSAVGHDEEGERGEDHDVVVSPAGGDGEGGEGADEEVDPAHADLAYLTQLSLIRGHLLVGQRLYQEGYAEQAATHMKHPGDELYADLLPAFTARGGKGFAEQLDTMAAKVAANAAKDEVTAAYQQLERAISDNERLVQASSATPAATLMLAVELLREAGEEYADGVQDGKVTRMHEYQDAYGFTQIAKQKIAAIATTGAEVQDAVSKASALVTELDGLWPSIMPSEAVGGNAADLYGAAARLELLALGLQRS